MTRIPFFVFMTALVCTASMAGADPVTYTIKAAGVSCQGSAAHAERTVRQSSPVESVTADPVSHSVTTVFDDDVVSLAAVVESLEDAGINVEETVRVE